MPTCEGGSDDPINLATSCWECNRGKGGNPLTDVATGEDPHDRALLLLEKQRQLREYDTVLSELLQERTDQAEELLNFWCNEAGVDSVPKRQFTWLVNTLSSVPATQIREAMMIAVSRSMTASVKASCGFAI